MRPLHFCGKTGMEWNGMEQYNLTTLHMRGQNWLFQSNVIFPLAILGKVVHSIKKDSTIVMMQIVKRYSDNSGENEKKGR